MIYFEIFMDIFNFQFFRFNFFFVRIQRRTYVNTISFEGQNDLKCKNAMTQFFFKCLIFILIKY